MRSAIRHERAGLALLLAALSFGAVFLAPELEIQRVALNDDVFHLAASERLLTSFRHGEPVLDPWVSEWGLGYPVWRSYQPLPHIIAAATLGATDSFLNHTTAYAWLKYLLLVFWPLSVYLGARWMGFRPTAAGIASLLVLGASSDGVLGRFGIAYGASVWRGSGLFTQVVALHALVLTLGIVARSLDTGRFRAQAAIALALTGLCHFVFGYVAGLSTLALAVTASKKVRWQRVSRVLVIGVGAAVLVAWFLVPLWLTRDVINHSRWESAYKWDSFGAPMILKNLWSGELFDAGRPPLLSCLLLVGTVVAVYNIREWLPRQLLVLAALWQLLFFGRATWGQLLRLVGVPSDLHVHRLQVAFELYAILLAAWGVHRLIVFAARARPLQVALAVTLVATIAMMGKERAQYLQQNASWGRESLKSYRAEERDIRKVVGDVRTLLERWPGRASAGPSSGWGHTFKVGSTPVYGLLTKAHIDEASFLYHSMSRASDLMVIRDEAKAAHVDAFAVRALVAPADKPMPPHFRRYSKRGRFAVYEGSREGYFGLVDVSGVYTGPRETRFEPSKTWLGTQLPDAHQVVALRDSPDLSPSLPRIPRWTSLPLANVSGPCGTITREMKRQENHAADVRLDRDCHVLFKVTWDPYLVARVDGVQVPLFEVTPGFGALPVKAGKHHVEVSYQPGPLRVILLVAGLVLFFAAVNIARLRSGIESLQLHVARALTAVAARVPRERAAAWGALLALALVALRPLFQGLLIHGHDATVYPPRLAQLARVLSDGHVPPVWAPDLGTGYGQPLFEFTPPLLYLAAMPLYVLGAHLTDALQWSLALLHMMGALAIYALARRMGSSRVTAVGVTAAWLFAPYTALDLYVRSAFAEAAALAVAPLAVMLLLRCVELGTVSSVVAAGVGVALVILGHNGAALLFLPVFAVLVAVAAADHRARVAGACAIAFGLASSAYFWVPALVEKSAVQTDLLREGFLNWRQHSIAWSQLLFSPWGYGLSVAGTNDGMSFALGLPHLALAAAGMVYALRSSARDRRLSLTFGALAVAGAWLATSSSSFLWERVEALQYFQFPWRALMLPGLFLPLLAMWGLGSLKSRTQLVVIAGLVLANLSHTEPKDYRYFDDEYYLPESIAKKGICTTTREEYAPRAARTALAYSAQKLLAPANQLDVISQRLETARQEFRVRARQTTPAEFATFAYPGWRASIDGREVPWTTEPRRGTMTIEVPTGEHIVRLELRPTGVRRWSSILSVLALAAAGVAMFGASWRKRRRRLSDPNDGIETAVEHVPATRSGIFMPAERAADASARRASARADRSAATGSRRRRT